MNGSGHRQCPSWIAAFIEFTDNLEADEIYRKWAAITTIAAALEQKVWLTTHSPLYPNLYTLLIGHPAVGKSTTISFSRRFLTEVPDLHIAPTSMTGSALVDSLKTAKKFSIDHVNDIHTEYHSMVLMPDEWGTFINSFKDNEVIPLLTSFYDTSPYGRNRTTGDIRIVLQRPQLNLLAGCTPSNLLDFIPAIAWGQGFTSRLILVYTNQHRILDDFANPSRQLPGGMITDLQHMAALEGEFSVSQEYREAMNEWRLAGEAPKPTHPKLAHYLARRKVHIYKLSMIAAIDEGNKLALELRHFIKAREWLEEIEINMPVIFNEGMTSVDYQSQEEIVEIIRQWGKPIPHHRLLNEIAKKVPAHAVVKVLDVLWLSGRIKKDQKSNTYVVNDD